MKKKIPRSKGKEATYEVGYKKPPKRTQFGQIGGNPAHHGAWKKEDTARFEFIRCQLEHLLQLIAIYEDNDAPLFERKLAACIHQGDWPVLSGMMTQVYGKPKEVVDLTQKSVLGIEISKSEKEILDIITND